MAEAQATTLPRRGFTAPFIDSLKPKPERYELADPATSGLVLRVSPAGQKSWRWYVRSLNRVITLGPWAANETPGHLTLREAREWLGRLKEARTAGEAQLAVVESALRAHLEPAGAAGPALTVRKAAEEFLERRIRPHRKRGDEEALPILEADVYPALGAFPMSWFDKHPKEARRACAKIVQGVVDRGAKVHAGKVLGLLKQFFRYCEINALVERSPAAPLDATGLGIQHNRRQRFLSVEEIPPFWRALDRDAPGKLSPATRLGLRILLATGVRSGELLLAEWASVDLEGAEWTIPVAHQKLTPKQAQAARPWVVPLSGLALELFQELKVATGKGRYVAAVPALKRSHLTEKVLGRALRRLQEPERTGVEPVLSLPGGLVSPHDLRRTMRTHLGKLKVAPHVAERCLNHSLGRILETYDVNDYLPERREALQLWGEYLRRLVAPEAARVAFLAAAP